MIMITPHETLLLIYLHIEKGDLGDIDGAMVDLLRVVHVQINHCNTIDIFSIMQMWNNDGTATENNKRVWFCLMWNNSLVSFMLEQRNLTREREKTPTQC